MIDPLSDLAQERIGNNQCPECGRNLVPDLEATTWSGPNKGKWDGHTYKGDCEHFPEDIRICVG